MSDNDQIIPINEAGELVYTQWDQLTLISKQIMNAGITKMGNPTQINLIILKGKRLKLDIFEALENIAVINNRTCISGALASALVERSGLIHAKSHEYSGEGDTRKCAVTVQRSGRNKVTWSFSIKEAKHAGLYPGKAGSGWSSYPDSMLYWRALGFCFRREFPDVMQGMYLTEEIQDEVREINITPEAEPKIPPLTPPPVPKRVIPFVPDPPPFVPDPEDPKAHQHPLISDPSDVAASKPPKSADEAKPIIDKINPVSESDNSDLGQLRALAAKHEVTEEMLIVVVNQLRLFPRGVEHKLENLPQVKVQTLLKNWPVVMRNVERIKAEQEKAKAEAEAEKAK